MSYYYFKPSLSKFVWNVMKISISINDICILYLYTDAYAGSYRGTQRIFSSKYLFSWNLMLASKKRE